MTVHRPFLAFAAALFTSPLPLVLLAIAAIPNAGGEPMTMREVAWGLFSLYGVALLYGIAAIFIFGLLVHRWFEERKITMKAAAATTPRARLAKPTCRQRVRGEVRVLA